MNESNNTNTQKKQYFSFEWTPEDLREDATRQIRRLHNEGRISWGWDDGELIDFIVWLGMQKDVYPIKGTVQTPREFFFKLIEGLPGTLG